MLLICSPMKIEIIAGGASFAPKRWALVADEMEALISPLYLYTVLITLLIKVMNCKFSLMVLPGLKSSTPVSVLKLQLLCLPLPLMPANGFSWSSTRKWWRRATCAITFIKRRLWSFAKFDSSKIGANSNWLGATSLCRVFAGIPSLWHSISKSSINSSTRIGMAPK